MLLAARWPEEAYDICCWLFGVRQRMIVVAGGPAQGSWRLCSQVASYTKLAFNSNNNNHIPTTCQVSLLAAGGCPDPPATVMPGSGPPFRPAAETHKPKTRRCSKVVPLSISIVCSRPIVRSAFDASLFNSACAKVPVRTTDSHAQSISPASCRPKRVDGHNPFYAQCQM